jgi:hypothetical protein
VELLQSQEWFGFFHKKKLLRAVKELHAGGGNGGGRGGGKGAISKEATKAKTEVKNNATPTQKTSNSGSGDGDGGVAVMETVVVEELDALRGEAHTATRDASTAVFNELLKERCGLLALVATETDPDSGSEKKVYRFPHLTFQEYFASEQMIADIEADLRRAEGQEGSERTQEGKQEGGGPTSDTLHEIFRRHFGEGESSKLYDVWYREVVLFVASGLQTRSFVRLVDWLLDTDDGSGAVQTRIHQMLRERGLLEDDRCTAEERQSRGDVLAKIANSRTAGFMAEALMHPSAMLRELALTELREYRMEAAPIARAVLKAVQGGDDEHGSDSMAVRGSRIALVAGGRGAGVLSVDDDRKMAGLRSVGLLSSGLQGVDREITVAALVQIWTERGGKFVERVRSEAGTAIATLQAQLMPVVQDAVCAQLQDGDRTRREAISNIRIFGITEANAPKVLKALLDLVASPVANSQRSTQAVVFSAITQLGWVTAALPAVEGLYAAGDHVGALMAIREFANAGVDSLKPHERHPFHTAAGSFVVPVVVAALEQAAVTSSGNSDDKGNSAGGNATSYADDKQGDEDNAQADDGEKVTEQALQTASCSFFLRDQSVLTALRSPMLLARGSAETKNTLLRVLWRAEKEAGSNADGVDNNDAKAGPELQAMIATLQHDMDPKVRLAALKMGLEILPVDAAEALGRCPLKHIRSITQTFSIELLVSLLFFGPGILPCKPLPHLALAVEEDEQLQDQWLESSFGLFHQLDPEAAVERLRRAMLDTAKPDRQQAAVDLIGVHPTRAFLQSHKVVTSTLVELLLPKYPLNIRLRVLPALDGVFQPSDLGGVVGVGEEGERDKARQLNEQGSASVSIANIDRDMMVSLILDEDASMQHVALKYFRAALLAKLWGEHENISAAIEVVAAHKDFAVRLNAMQLVTILPRPRAVAMILWLMNDTDRSVRAQAIRQALGATKESKAADYRQEPKLRRAVLAVMCGKCDTDHDGKAQRYALCLLARFLPTKHEAKSIIDVATGASGAKIGAEMANFHEQQEWLQSWEARAAAVAGMAEIDDADFEILGFVELFAELLSSGGMPLGDNGRRTDVLSDKKQSIDDLEAAGDVLKGLVLALEKRAVLAFDPRVLYAVAALARTHSDEHVRRALLLPVRKVCSVLKEGVRDSGGSSAGDYQAYTPRSGAYYSTHYASDQAGTSTWSPPVEGLVRVVQLCIQICTTLAQDTDLEISQDAQVVLAEIEAVLPVCTQSQLLQAASSANGADGTMAGSGVGSGISGHGTVSMAGDGHRDDHRDEVHEYTQILLDGLNDVGAAPYLFTPLLSYLRRQRDEDPRGWALDGPSMLKLHHLLHWEATTVVALPPPDTDKSGNSGNGSTRTVGAGGTLEATFVMKDLKVGKFCDGSIPYWKGDRVRVAKNVSKRERLLARTGLAGDPTRVQGAKGRVGSEGQFGRLVNWQSMTGNLKAEGGMLERVEGTEYGWTEGCTSSNRLHMNGSEQGIEWVVTTIDKDYAIGLTNSAKAREGTGFTGIDFGIKLDTQSQCVMLEGAGESLLSITYAVGDKFQVTVKENTVSFMLNGKLLRNARKKPTFPLMVDCCFSSVGAKVDCLLLSSMDTLTIAPGGVELFDQERAEQEDRARAEEEAAAAVQEAGGLVVLRRVRGHATGCDIHADYNVVFGDFGTVAAPAAAFSSAVNNSSSGGSSGARKLFYELELTQFGGSVTVNGSAAGLQQAGWACDGFDLSNKPSCLQDGVGDDDSSWAIDGGRILRWGDGNHDAWGEGWECGDVIGLAADLVSGKLHFGRNGHWAGPMGCAFDSATMRTPLPKQGLYPAVSAQNCSLQFNFGDRPWKFGPPPADTADTAGTSGGGFVGVHQAAGGADLQSQQQEGAATEQLERLYLPLQVELAASSKEWSTFCASYNTAEVERQKQDSKRRAGMAIFDDSAPPDAESVLEWRAFIRDVSRPRHLRIETILTRCGQLHNGEKYPECFTQMHRHIDGYRTLLIAWEANERTQLPTAPPPASCLSKDNVSPVVWPPLLQRHVDEAVRELRSPGGIARS